MNILAELQKRFAAALTGLVDDPADFLQLVRPSQDPKFGDYQANLAMPLGKRLGQPPREVAAQIVGRLSLNDLCEPPQIEGPGFINLRIKDAWLDEQLSRALVDERLGVEKVASPRTYIVDYSAPNVAKPMHVGHIRSTVIGDALYRILGFLGHRVTSDNHIGDWGTQFGMIIYGYKHFLDSDAYQKNAVEELSRLYRFVNRLLDYFDSRESLPRLQGQIAQQQAAVAAEQAALEKKPPDAQRAAAKALRRSESNLQQLIKSTGELESKLDAVAADPVLSTIAQKHPDIARDVLAETARLHDGDPENLRLWKEFMPPCLVAIDKIYRRLGVHFDDTLGESFYHDRLAPVVEDLEQRGIARASEGAICVFLTGQETPLVIRKQDGAFLYATTDLATIQYRAERWQPDAILYVVDHRQSLHFQQLFATAKLWGYRELELQHVSFGTVLGDDGRPFKTRSGDTVGLESLLDEAVRRAHEIVSSTDDGKPGGREMSDERRREVAEAVGIGALKYADLSQNRTSDYTFSYDKMLAMNGNTATYMQYAYARVLSIFAKGQVDIAALRAKAPALRLVHPAERALGLSILQCSEALTLAAVDYRPNHLTVYLYELANRYSTFFEQCPVLRADDDATRETRLLLCDLTARVLKLGLSLLNIQVVDKM